MNRAPSITALVRRIFLISTSVAVAATLACYLLLSHAKTNQLRAELQAKVDGLLQSQAPFILQELVNDRFYAAAIRGRQIREDSGREVEVGVYRIDRSPIFESEHLQSLRQTTAPEGFLPTLADRFLYSRRILHFAGEPIGEVIFAMPEVTTALSKQFTLLLWVTLGVVLGALCVLFWILQRTFRRSLRQPLHALNDAIPAIARYLDDHTDTLELPRDLGLRELDAVAETLFSMTETLKAALKERKAILIKDERASAVALISRQVAHDIRSPLTALLLAVDDLTKLPESQRTLLRSAAIRISDIANNLLNTNQSLFEGARPTTNPDAEPQLLPVLVEMVLSEKRFQYKARSGLRLTSRWAKALYDGFACIDPSDFKRVISNLVDNAAEASGDEGRVRIELEGFADTIRVTVRDDGRGIPEAVRPKLMQAGITHAKPGGTGLGLFFARTAVERARGTIEIRSTEGRGTTVAITLPRAAPPSWFVPSVRVTVGDTVIVLDDDPSIHRVWQQRFDERGFSARCRIVHCLQGDQVRAAIAELGGDISGVLLLADDELLGQSASGLDLIAELGLAERAILVTGRFEEVAVRARCFELGVGLLPKPFSAIVPITLIEAPASILPPPIESRCEGVRAAQNI